MSTLFVINLLTFITFCDILYLEVIRMFGNNLKRLRQDRNLTQQKLADILGVSRSAIGMYEGGEREPDFETLEVIADFFNVRLDELISDPKKLIYTQPDLKLNEHERELVLAYRQQPSMQEAVDRLLGIEPEQIEIKKQA